MSFNVDGHLLLTALGNETSSETVIWKIDEEDNAEMLVSHEKLLSTDLFVFENNDIFLW